MPITGSGGVPMPPLEGGGGPGGGGGKSAAGCAPIMAPPSPIAPLVLSMLRVCHEMCEAWAGAAGEDVSATAAVELKSMLVATAKAAIRDSWRIRITPCYGPTYPSTQTESDAIPAQN